MAAVRHRLRKLKMPRSRTLMIAVAVVGVLFLVGSVLYFQFSRDTAQTQTAVAEGQRDATADRAEKAADPVLELCREQSAVGAALRANPGNPCGLAQQVKTDPIAGPAGPRGDTGSTGAIGPAGPMGPMGPAGPQGPAGPAGPQGDAGPAGSDGADGSDGTNGTNGSDGATGPPGPTGPQGPAGRDGSPAESSTFTYPDGTTQTCTRSGGSDTAPTYSCTTSMPTPLETP